MILMYDGAESVQCTVYHSITINNGVLLLPTDYILAIDYLLRTGFRMGVRGRGAAGWPCPEIGMYYAHSISITCVNIGVTCDMFVVRGGLCDSSQ